VKEWVAENIVRWQAEKTDFFNIEKIPDVLLPSLVVEGEGGRQRRRSSVSVREIVGVRELAITRAALNDNSRQAKEAWNKLAEETYESTSKEFDENVDIV